MPTWFTLLEVPHIKGTIDLLEVEHDPVTGEPLLDEEGRPQSVWFVVWQEPDPYAGDYAQT